MRPLEVVGVSEGLGGVHVSSCLIGQFFPTGHVQGFGLNGDMEYISRSDIPRLRIKGTRHVILNI